MKDVIMQFEYQHPDCNNKETGKITRKEDARFSAFYSYFANGECVHSSLADFDDEIGAQNFLYHKLQSSTLNSYWLTMDACIDRQQKPIKDEMNRLCDTLPSIRLECYKKMMGELPSYNADLAKENLQKWLDRKEK